MKKKAIKKTTAKGLIEEKIKLYLRSEPREYSSERVRVYTEDPSGKNIASVNLATGEVTTSTNTIDNIQTFCSGFGSTIGLKGKLQPNVVYEVELTFKVAPKLDAKAIQKAALEAALKSLK